MAVRNHRHAKGAGSGAAIRASSGHSHLFCEFQARARAHVHASLQGERPGLHRFQEDGRYGERHPEIHAGKKLDRRSCLGIHDGTAAESRSARVQPAHLSPAFLEVNAVTKIYRTARGMVTALENISFAVDRGEFLAIVGPSGCGKSTLLRIIAGLRTATDGTVLLEGTKVTAPLRTGMVF